MMAKECTTGERTTVMLRNIPNKYSTKMLLELVNSKGFKGTYDFFYLPMDFVNKCGKGYCFVNFRDPVNAQKCSDAFDKFDQWVFKSVKVCAATFAVVQGLKCNCDKMRGSPVVTDPLIPDDYKPILIAEDGSQTVLGREMMRDGMSCDTWRHIRDDSSSIGHVFSPYAEEFVPGRSCGEDYFRKLIEKIKTRPQTTVDRPYEIVYDIQIQHDPEYKLFPIVEHVQGPESRKMLALIHMASGALELRLCGPPLHLVLGADRPDVFEEGKETVEDHLRNVYKWFTKFAETHKVNLDRPLKVRAFREKRPDQPYRDGSELNAEPDVEDLSPIMDEKRYLDQLDTVEPPDGDSQLDSPIRRSSFVEANYNNTARYDPRSGNPFHMDYELAHENLQQQRLRTLAYASPQRAVHVADGEHLSAAYLCKGFVQSHYQQAWNGYGNCMENEMDREVKRYSAETTTATSSGGDSQTSAVLLQ